MEDRARRVDHPPDHDDADLDRIPLFVVDLLLFVVQRHRLQRDLAAHADRGAGSGVISRTKGIDPEKTVLFDRPVILAEQRQNDRLVRMQDFQPEQPDQSEQNEDDPGDAEEQRYLLLIVQARHAAQGDAARRKEDPEQQKQPAAHRPQFFLLHRPLFVFHRHTSVF